MRPVGEGLGRRLDAPGRRGADEGAFAQGPGGGRLGEGDRAAHFAATCFTTAPFPWGRIAASLYCVKKRVANRDSWPLGPAALVLAVSYASSLVGQSFLPEAAFRFVLDSRAPPPEEVLFVAAYYGSDLRGQGRWRGENAMLRPGGVFTPLGRAVGPPWEVVWDTRRVPGQPDGDGIAVRALARGRDGLWTATKVLEDLALAPREYSLRLYETVLQPDVFLVRAGRLDSCVIDLPMDFDPSKVEGAELFIRSWNLNNNEEGYTPFLVNGSPWMTHLRAPGSDHRFHQGFFGLPVEHLQPGPNLLSFTSATRHHGCEILWPVPALIARHRPEASTA